MEPVTKYNFDDQKQINKTPEKFNFKAISWCQLIEYMTFVCSFAFQKSSSLHEFEFIERKLNGNRKKCSKKVSSDIIVMFQQVMSFIYFHIQACSKVY